MLCRGCPTQKRSALYQRFSDSDMVHFLSCSNMVLVDMSAQFADSIELSNYNRSRMEGKGRSHRKRMSSNWKMIKKKFLSKEPISRLYHLSCF
jgi:hypothetical protein